MEILFDPNRSDEDKRVWLKGRGDLPKHVAIIMDGNGRWAKGQGKKRVFGHKKGIETVRQISEAAAEAGIECLTLYTFSTENWTRPKAEVRAIMELLVRTIRKETKTLMDNNIRLLTIGDLDALPPKCKEELLEGMEETAANTAMNLILALSYSGRWEITEAVRQIAEKVGNSELNSEDIDSETISNHLQTAGLPDPDLLIRTGGDNRISNFLLWQVAYSEIVITETPWPAYTKDDFYQSLAIFQDRERRFGGLNEPSK